MFSADHTDKPTDTSTGVTRARKALVASIYSGNRWTITHAFQTWTMQSFDIIKRQISMLIRNNTTRFTPDDLKTALDNQVSESYNGHTCLKMTSEKIIKLMNKP